MKKQILLIDDEKNYLLVLSELLSEEGYSVSAFHDPEMAMAYLDESEVDVVITDMRMPKLSGQEILDKVRHDFPYIPVIILTAHGDVLNAVESMKRGAFEYIVKPFSNEDMLRAVAKACKLFEAEFQNRLLRQTLVKQNDRHNIIGTSKPIQNILSLIDRVAPSKTSVLITGESGTGKELVAKAIHFSSDRKDNPFISVNCAALNTGVLESELFGHEKGSFTGAIARKRGRFEMAQHGTLFLDEIGELSLDIQVKLLRVLQERVIERVGGTETIPIDFRLVVATNKNLKESVIAGTFREDLLYRLNVVGLEMPPLRDRREDIPLLVAHFLQKYDGKEKKFIQEAMNSLISYDWPGNVRQLENVVERCVVLSRDNIITNDDLPGELQNEEHQLQSVLDLFPVELDLTETLDKIESALIRRTFVRSGFIKSKAAEMLGISKSLFQYKLKKYDISGMI